MLGSDDPDTQQQDADFAKLDVDGSGGLSAKEVELWEAGNFDHEDLSREAIKLLLLTVFMAPSVSTWDKINIKDDSAQY